MGIFLVGMFFRCFGGRDCPEWLIFAISRIPRQMTVAQFSTIVKSASAASNHGAVNRVVGERGDDEELLFAALVLLLESVRRFRAHQSLKSELQLLGLS